MSPTSSWPRQPGAGVARHGAVLKVHRDSHSIHKATSPPLSSGSTNSSVSSSSNGAIITSSSGHHRPAPASPPPRRQPQAQYQPPVIIYTHSPKVIHTNPRDFMSIVQQLTGLDSHGGRGAAPPPPVPAPAGRIINSGSVAIAAPPQDESSSSSSESCANNTQAVGPPPPYADWQLMPPPPPLDAFFMAPDMPLQFAPDAAAPDLQQLWEPRGLYGQFPPVDASAVAIGGPLMSTNIASNGGAVFSPSMVDAMRTFPGYN